MCRSLRILSKHHNYNKHNYFNMYNGLINLHTIKKYKSYTLNIICNIAVNKAVCLKKTNYNNMYNGLIPLINKFNKIV